MDVFPTIETKQLYADIKPLIENETINAAFAKYEERAVQLKFSFHILGRLAISLIAVSAVYAIADALVIPDFSGKIWVSILLGLSAACGIIIQVYLLMTDKKAEWLIARFAAERLRSIKFQTFAFADVAETEEDLSELVSVFSLRETAKLENEINAGVSVLGTFRPTAAMELPKTQGGPKNTELSELAFDAYKELRLDYQFRFSSSEIHRLKSGRRYIATLSDILFLGGASLVLASLVFKIFFVSEVAIGNWIDFLASATFISAIANAILEHGGLSSRSESRFVDYVTAIEEIPKVYPRRTGMVGVIRKMELAALEELRSFSESSILISYRM